MDCNLVVMSFAGNTRGAREDMNMDKKLLIFRATKGFILLI